MAVLILIITIAGIAAMTYGLLWWLKSSMDCAFGDDCLKKFLDDCRRQGQTFKKKN